MEPIQINFDWVLRVCDHVRYHENSVDMGISTRTNPAYVTGILDFQPKNIFGAAWFLDACGFELCFEIIDTSFTMHKPNNEFFELSANDWGVSFRWNPYVRRIEVEDNGQGRSTFQSRYGNPAEVRLWGDPEAFARAKTLLELVLPLREDVYYHRLNPVGMVNVQSAWLEYSNNENKFAGGINDLKFLEMRKKQEAGAFFMRFGIS
jgi:hypothetical protein